jgi:hypothetical protein
MVTAASLLLPSLIAEQHKTTLSTEGGNDTQLTTRRTIEESLSLQLKFKKFFKQARKLPILKKQEDRQRSPSRPTFAEHVIAGPTFPIKHK